LGRFLISVGLSLSLVLATSATAQTALSVQVAPASELFVRPAREAQAVVKARNASRISSEVTAVVLEINTDVGQQVGAGELLAKLDDTDVRLSMAQAVAQRDGLRASLSLARRQLKRLKDLKTKNFVSTEAVNQRSAEVVTLRAELKGSDARVAVIKRQLVKCLVRAPFDAVVSERSAQIGELTVPGTPLFTLVQVGDEEVSASLSTADASYLTKDADYEFNAQGSRVALKLLRVSPLVSERTRTREARFSFSADALASGTQGVVRWADSRVHLPPKVLVRRDNKLGVFVLRENVARFIAIESAQEGRPAPTNLAGTEKVIVGGQARLQDGDKPRVLATQ
jgi:RND family efflux transporter MFP subunit